MFVRSSEPVYSSPDTPNVVETNQPINLAHVITICPSTEGDYGEGKGGYFVITFVVAGNANADVVWKYAEQKARDADFLRISKIG